MAALKTSVWVAGVLALAALPAFAADQDAKAQADKEIAASFVAEAKGDTVAIYSNLKKPRRCEVDVSFSVAQGGQRVKGDLRCFEKDLEAGEHLLTCNIKDPQIIDPKIEGPIIGHCK